MKPSQHRYGKALLSFSLLVGSTAFIWLLMLCITAQASDFEQNVEKTFSVQPGGKLVLAAGFGPILVTTQQQNAVQIKVLRKVNAKSKEEADKVFADHELTFRQDGNTVIAESKMKQQKPWRLLGNSPSLQLRFEVAVPANFDLELSTAGGDIHVPDIDGQVVARTSSGRIQLGKISKTVETSNAGGNIEIYEAGGPLKASTSSGSIHVEVAKAKAHLANAGGDIKLDNVGGDLTASTSSGSIHLGNADATVTLRNAGGNISIGQVAGTLTASTSSGSIQIESAKGKVELRNAGGNITIQEASSGLVASTSSGTIRAGTISGSSELNSSGGSVEVAHANGATKIRTSSGSIKVHAADGPVDARDAGGSIEIEKASGPVTAHTSSGTVSIDFANAPKEECQVEVAGGGVKIGLPSDAAVTLDAHASGGSVHSEFPIAVSTSQRQMGSLSGPINGGGPTLKIRSSSGDISVRKSSATATKSSAKEKPPVHLEDAAQ